MIFTDWGLLAADVRARVKEPAIIGIDGWTGAGKTTLANALASITGGAVFDLDEALIRDQKSFVTALQFDFIRKALAQPSRLLFVSGICLRQVLELAECDATAHIYVKRMAEWGWADEEKVADPITPEFAGARGEATRREMRPYHQEWLPHLRADYEFHRPG